MVCCRRLAPILYFILAVLPAVPCWSGTSTRPSAQSLFAGAKAEARRTHRNVLVDFSASWCGPCKLFDQFLRDPQMRAIHGKVFVLQRVTVGEFAPKLMRLNTPGGPELRSSLGAVQDTGLPFLVITDPAGVPIVNSYRNGDTHDNTGGPMDEDGIAWYMEMLKRGAPGLSEEDRATVLKWLRGHSPAIKSELPITPLQVR